MSQPTLWGHASRVPGRGWRGTPPLRSPREARTRAEVTGGGLARLRPSRRAKAAAAEVERERTRQVARIGNNLNQIARWASIGQPAFDPDALAP